tara:strand:+ start:19291 stop:19470 length:180 start_codon:yes stop_codon:yes gene_type:complete
MKNKKTKWSTRLYLWWEEMGGVYYEEGKPNRRPQFIFNVVGFIIMPMALVTVSILSNIS